MGGKNKKSFIFYASWKEVLKEYPAEVRLEVYDAVIEYAISGTLSELKPLAKMAFAFIQRDIDANDEKYLDMVSKRSEAGKKGMKSRWGDSNNKCCDAITNVTNITDNDNKDDDVDVNDNVLNTYKQKDELPETSVVKKKEDAIDYDSIVKTFNSMLAPPLPKVITLSVSRKQSIKARIKEHGLESVSKVFELVKNSRFLRGENDNGWKCYFDWIFNPKNFVKILEGNYADTRTNYSEKRAVNAQVFADFLADREQRTNGLAIEVEKPF